MKRRKKGKRFRQAKMMPRGGTLMRSKQSRRSKVWFKAGKVI
jgi:hypothetical protein